MRIPTVAIGAVVSLVLALPLGCGESGSTAGPSSQASTTPTQSASNPDVAKASNAAKSAPPAKKKPRRERPLPAFSGYTLDDERVEIAKLLGKRILIFVFNPEVPEAPIGAAAVAAISSLRGKQNFEIVGVATGSDRQTASAFAAEHGFDFPVIDDSRAEVANRLGLRQPMALFGVDADGYVQFGLPVVGTAEGAAFALEAQLREALRLPSVETGSEPVLGTRPTAPPFEARILDGETFRLADHRGQAVVLIFFLHTCPHCHETLEFMRGALAELPEDKRPLLVGVEVTGRTGAVRGQMKGLGLDFFPILFDDDGSIQTAYGVFAGVPDTFFIDAEGRIADRVRGWQAEKDEPIARMRMAKLAGAPIPMLLRAKGYSGSDACGVCHESQHETWLFTRHARAFDTLVKHGAATDEECVGCHVVGYQQAGGFESATETPDLEDVGCEMCHGRGGPHLSPQFAGRSDYAPSCEGCHDQKHSLGFEYATFLPKVSHAANAHVLQLSVDEKRERLAALGAPRDVLASSAAYVGSDACRGCHESEYATWLAGPHAHAGETLEAKAQGGDAACQKCHTTAFGRTGGFPSGADLAAHADFARVGCESCHGPGGDHVAADATKLGSIISLGDKCDSCVILQICGTCHDDANDPGFEFEVEAKIEAQRHGTIEPGTGTPKGATAARLQPLDVARSPGSGALDRAFALHEQRDAEAAVWTVR